MNELRPRDPQNDELSLTDGLSILWGRRWLILLAALLGAAAGASAAMIFPKKFTASVVVVPVSSSNGSGSLGALGGLASQFGGLASLAGVAVPGDSRKNEAMAVLQSEALTERYIQDHDLLPVLFRKRWDPVRKQWNSSDADDIPTLWKANDYFKRNIRSVSNDTKSGLATLSITWRDPKMAATWANDLVRMTNQYLRTKEIAEAEANIAYLNEQAIRSDVLPIKQGIYTMLQSEINKVMIAKGSTEFALKVVDPAVAPEKAVTPQPVLWTIFGLATGLLFACTLAFYLPGRESIPVKRA